MTKTTTTTLTAKQQELLNAQKGKKVSFAKLDMAQATDLVYAYEELVKEFTAEGGKFEDTTILRPRLIWPADPAWDMNFQRMQRKVQIAEKRQELYRLVEMQMQITENRYFA